MTYQGIKCVKVIALLIGLLFSPGQNLKFLTERGVIFGKGNRWKFKTHKRPFESSLSISCIAALSASRHPRLGLQPRR